MGSPKTNERKLCYQFRVHDLEEFETAKEFIKNRKFGVYDYKEEKWYEFRPRYSEDDVLQIMNKYDNDVMFRVYFNCDYKRDKFRKDWRFKAKSMRCGNDNCDKKDCPYSYWDNSFKADVTEYLWRCILADEHEYQVKDKYLQKGACYVRNLDR